MQNSQLHPTVAAYGYYNSLLLVLERIVENLTLVTFKIYLLLVDLSKFLMYNLD